MDKHTPGPWTENACEIQAQDGSPICEMLARPEDSGVNYPYSPVADSNARLIAAAPEMLAVLSAARNSISDALNPDPSTDWRDSLSDALDAIDAAIESAAKKHGKREGGKS